MQGFQQLRKPVQKIHKPVYFPQQFTIQGPKYIELQAERGLICSPKQVTTLYLLHKFIEIVGPLYR